MNYDLQGRCALITGANQGLGLVIARTYVAAGASVMLCARNVDLLRTAQLEVSTLAKSGQAVLAESGDVSNPDDVERIVGRTLNAFPRLHILVNNAGVYGPKGGIETVDWEEWVDAIRINLLGSVLMSRTVIPHFKTHQYGKIIQVSGGGVTNPLPFISAYACSKAAVVKFAETLAEETKMYNICVNSIAPGALNTRMLDEILAAGPEKVGDAFYERAQRQKAEGGVPLEKGAALALFLGSSASDGITGRLISAVWDSWEALPLHKVDLWGTDIYTLRRITPKDRGRNWDKR